MYQGNKTRILLLAISIFTLFITPITIFVVSPPPAHADTAEYFYDDLGSVHPETGVLTTRDTSGLGT